MKFKKMKRGKMNRVQTLYPTNKKINDIEEA